MHFIGKLFSPPPPPPPPPPPAASPPVFFEFKLPFCVSVWASADVLHTVAGLPSQIYKCLTSMI